MVGVVLNLALWFSLNVLFGVVNERFVGPVRVYVPEFGTIDWAALAIAAAAFVALFRFKVSMLWTLAGAAVAGLLYFLVFVG